jgi:hypothetical protein
VVSESLLKEGGSKVPIQALVVTILVSTLIRAIQSRKKGNDHGDEDDGYYVTGGRRELCSDTIESFSEDELDSIVYRLSSPGGATVLSERFLSSFGDHVSTALSAEQVINNCISTGSSSVNSVQHARCDMTYSI